MTQQIHKLLINLNQIVHWNNLNCRTVCVCGYCQTTTEFYFYLNWEWFKILKLETSEPSLHLAESSQKARRQIPFGFASGYLTPSFLGALSQIQFRLWGFYNWTTLAQPSTQQGTNHETLAQLRHKKCCVRADAVPGIFRRKILGVVRRGAAAWRGHQEIFRYLDILQCTVGVKTWHLYDNQVAVISRLHTIPLCTGHWTFLHNHGDNTNQACCSY